MERLERQKKLALEASEGLKALEKEAKRQASRMQRAPVTLSSRIALAAAIGVMRGIAGSYIESVRRRQKGSRKTESAT